MRWLSKTSNKIIMLLPTLAVYLIFIIMPVFVTIYYSFTKFTGPCLFYGVEKHLHRSCDDLADSSPTFIYDCDLSGTCFQRK